MKVTTRDRIMLAFESLDIELVVGVGFMATEGLGTTKRNLIFEFDSTGEIESVRAWGGGRTDSCPHTDTYTVSEYNDWIIARCRRCGAGKSSNGWIRPALHRG